MLSQIRRTWSLIGGWSGVCTCQTGARTKFSSRGLFIGSGLVLQSRSTDVHHNLALEDWIDANVDLQHCSILLLWRNRSAVVIGRHQNPWTECNLPVMRRMGIPLARRRSGGGTVYHDLGNLNLTFFTSKKAYDRKRNLKVITEALRQVRPGLDVQATGRFDILLNGHYKISGTASRLSKKSSYHHCTLLYSAERSVMTTVLNPSHLDIHSNATPSVPSPVANLQDYVPSLQWEELLDALVHQYNAEFGFNSALTLVDPADESLFPGHCKFATELQSWDWTFGKTPMFSVHTFLELKDSRSLAQTRAKLHMEIKNGLIGSCELDIPADWLPEHLSGELSALLVGERFCRHRAAAALSALLRFESGDLTDRLHNLCDAVLSVMG